MSVGVSVAVVSGRGREHSVYRNVEQQFDVIVK